MYDRLSLLCTVLYSYMVLCVLCTHRTIHVYMQCSRQRFKQGGPPFLSFGLDLDRLGKIDTVEIDQKQFSWSMLKVLIDAIVWTFSEFPISQDCCKCRGVTRY